MSKLDGAALSTPKDLRIAGVMTKGQMALLMLPVRYSTRNFDYSARHYNLSNLRSCDYAGSLVCRWSAAEEVNRVER